MSILASLEARFFPPLTPTDQIAKTIRVCRALQQFWSSAHGWAPSSAAGMLEQARLDRQVAFAHTLHDYLIPFSPETQESRQILGYVTLRSMCEGALKLFFSVWLEDYRGDSSAPTTRAGVVIDPADVTFDRLIAFFSQRINSSHDAFLRRVQQRGNAIHSFKDRDIGTQQELIDDILAYGQFIVAISDGLPYPDGMYDPALA